MPSPAPSWRRTFSAFPGGRPGFGLLLLRLTVGAELGWCSYARLSPWQNAGPVIVGAAMLMLASAASLVAGYRTAFSSLVGAALSIVVLASWPTSGLSADATRVGSGFAVVIAAALALLGPGAFSLDARRYGHREIVIPRTSVPGSDD